MSHTFAIGDTLFSAVKFDSPRNHWRVRLEETGEVLNSGAGGISNISVPKMKASIQNLLDGVSNGDIANFRDRFGLNATPPEQINLLVDDTKDRIEKFIRNDRSLADLTAFKVHIPEGDRILPMTHGLTDRWGDPNDYTAKNRFAKALFENEAQLEKLRGTMVDEESFITATPRGYALHIEKEYYSTETDATEDFKPNHTFDQILKICLDAIPALREKWPDVTFCVGDTDWTFNGRVALWAIVRPGRYTTKQLREMVSEFPT